MPYHSVLHHTASEALSGNTPSGLLLQYQCGPRVAQYYTVNGVIMYLRLAVGIHPQLELRPLLRKHMGNNQSQR